MDGLTTPKLYRQGIKRLIRLRGCAGLSAPLLFAYNKVRFSQNWVHISFIGKQICMSTVKYKLPSKMFQDNDEDLFSLKK